MLTLPTKIFLCREPVNMRMSFEGLGTLVEQLFPAELLTGALFLFFNKSRSCLKALFWDRDGFCILYKRLERGVFTSNMQNPILDCREFLMLLEGITPQKLRPKFPQKRSDFPYENRGFFDTILSMKTTVKSTVESLQNQLAERDQEVVQQKTEILYLKEQIAWLTR